MYIYILYIYVYMKLGNNAPLEKSNIFTSACFSSAQSSFIQKFKLDFCENICRAHTTVWGRFITYETQNFLKRKFIISFIYIYIYILYIYNPINCRVFMVIQENLNESCPSIVILEYSIRIFND